MQRRHSRPIAIRELLDGLLRRHGIARRSDLDAVARIWPQVVPAQLRARCRPLSLRDALLRVGVTSAPALEELRGYRAAELLRLLNQTLAADPATAQVIVRKIEYRLA